MDKINFDHINSCGNQRQNKSDCNELVDANTNAFHYYGRKAKAFVEQCRIDFAHELNVLPAELYFSESHIKQRILLINALILFADINDVFVSAFEPVKWLGHLKNLEKNKKIKIHWINTDGFGAINLSEFQKQTSLIKRTSFVSLSHANEYNGLLIPVKEIAKLCRQENTLFHLDIKPSIGKYKIDLENLNPDFASLDLSEYQGGRNSGIIYMNQKIKISDAVFHQLKSNLQLIENKDIFAICRLNNSMKEAKDNLETNYKSISAIKKYFIEQFYHHFKLKNIIADYHKEGIYSMITYFFPENKFGKFQPENLDIENIITQKIDYPFKKEKGTFIQFSFDANNTKAEIDNLVLTIKKLINKK
ncbi:MAG: aminotransferase class V-fold PLP-dependent enzyme [Bacteroidales bacterium]|nr:aminotransferase class V-fold PLP-dependent enzyme [Bacteroidales bacterium]